ncbi:MAG TPA: 30S ribosomal protein S20 [Pirellulales bacterium]|nr:30S ribosomal protein S20 [Pirellulales bacterium]
MPNTKSAKKRLKQSLVRRTRNRATKSALKTHSRRVRDAIAEGNLEKATTEFRLATARTDKAAAHGVIHANAAARVKSRLSAALKAAKQNPAKPNAAKTNTSK